MKPDPTYLNPALNPARPLRFAGAAPSHTRVLLVGDTLATQLVIAAALRREDHLVDIANDGKAALRALRRQPYDLVLMDLLMPGMSGIEVAWRIRALPAPAGAVPIIGFTANVAPEDRAACREAGMSGILEKPVIMTDLVAAIAEHVWRPGQRRTGGDRGDRETSGQRISRESGQVASRAIGHPQPDGESQPLLDVGLLAELRAAIAAGTFSSMVEECLTDLAARLPGLRRAVQDNATAAIIAEAHAMVGAAAGYGMAALAAQLGAVIDAARRGDTATVARLAAGLDATLARTGEAFRQTLQSGQTLQSERV